MPVFQPSRRWLLPLALPLAAACAEPEPQLAADTAAVTQPALSPEMAAKVAARLQRSKSRAPFVGPSDRASLADVDGQELVDALDIPASFDPTFVALTSPDPDASYVRDGLGIIRPRRGSTFLVLSTGRTGRTVECPLPAEPGECPLPAEPGVDFAPDGVAAGDVSTLRFQITVPPHLNRLSFDYTFLSAETPEWVGTQFNDTFTARVSDAAGADRVVATASVNESVFHPSSDTNVGKSPFLLIVEDPVGVDDAFGRGMAQDAGTTDYQHVDVQVAPGVVTIELDIRDVADGILDSAIIVDNMALSAIELADGHDSLVDDDGRIFRAPDPRLASLGVGVNAVAADGVTQLVVRSNVPGPGRVDFALASAAASDGQLSPADDSESWGPAASVDAVLVGDQWYGIALYRSPPDFNVGPGNATAPSRDAPLAMTYTPTAGAAFTESVSLSIVPPPVIVVPDVWTSCLSWQTAGALLDPDPAAHNGIAHPFTATCARYEETNTKSLDRPENKRAVASAINTAFIKLRDSGTAVTRADVIGHGLGGVLARRHIDDDHFVDKSNFLAGRINRLITMNTQHLGSRLLDEIVRFRDFQRSSDPANWTSVKRRLGEVGITIDPDDEDVALDQLRTTSAVIKDIAKDGSDASVRYHAMVTSGGREILRLPFAFGLVPASFKSLIVEMEQYHPLTVDADGPVKFQLVYGRNSPIFCTDAQVHDFDNHDLFATTLEQSGGLAAQFTTAFTVNRSNGNSDHFDIRLDRAHTQTIVDLLNAPVDGGLFATAMASPRDVTLENSCPIVIPSALGRRARAVAAPPGTIAITSPAPETIVVPGNDVAVTVDVGATSPMSVLIYGLGNSVYLESPPFTASFTIPVDSLGSYALHAVAFYDHGGSASAAPVSLNLEITAPLVSLAVVNGAMVLERPGRTQQLLVGGTYADGVLRNLTHAPGTEYQATNIAPLAPVASVSPTGEVTALAPGRATVAVRNGSVITSIDVKVGEPRCGDEVVDPGELCDDGNTRNGDGCSSACQIENHPPIAVCSEAKVCNDPGQCFATVTNLGDGSSDPDGQPLTITQYPEGPYSVGDHAVEVTVSDGALQAQCFSKLDVFDCERPALTCPASFSVECTGNGGAFVRPPPANASDNCGSVNVRAPAAARRPLGANRLSYTATDPAGNAASCTTTATVVDTQPPLVKVGTPPALIPADHAYRTVSLDDCDIEVFDTCGGTLSPQVAEAEITCVTADEPDNAPGNGDGNTTNDIVIVDRRTVKLRAERITGGNGRIYNVGFRVRDAAGNRADATCSFIVPPSDQCLADTLHPVLGCEAADDGPSHSVCRP